MKTARYALFIQTRARIIKDATGTARTICKIGENTALKTENFAESTAPAAPTAIPDKYPEVMRSIEYRTATQKSLVMQSSFKVKKTAYG